MNFSDSEIDLDDPGVQEILGNFRASSSADRELFVATARAMCDAPQDWVDRLSTTVLEVTDRDGMLDVLTAALAELEPAA